jgi:hypothetical protein
MTLIGVSSLASGFVAVTECVLGNGVAVIIFLFVGIICFAKDVLGHVLGLSLVLVRLGILVLVALLFLT